MKFESFPYMIIVGLPNKRFAFFFKTKDEADDCVNYFSKCVNCFINLYEDIYEDDGMIGYEKTQIIKPMEVENDL